MDAPRHLRRGALLLTVSALRNRVSFRMAARNLPRRRAQTTLVVLGLMLATMLFSASFTTGDTLTNSLRIQALENLGQVDVQLQARGQGSSDGGPGGGPFGGATAERARYFDGSVAGDVRDRLSGRGRVEGVAPSPPRQSPSPPKAPTSASRPSACSASRKTPCGASTSSPPPRATPWASTTSAATRST